MESGRGGRSSKRDTRERGRYKERANAIGAAAATWRQTKSSANVLDVAAAVCQCQPRYFGWQDAYWCGVRSMPRQSCCIWHMPLTDPEFGRKLQRGKCPSCHLSRDRAFRKDQLLIAPSLIVSNNYGQLLGIALVFNMIWLHYCISHRPQRVSRLPSPVLLPNQAILSTESSAESDTCAVRHQYLASNQSSK